MLVSVTMLLLMTWLYCNSIANFSVNLYGLYCTYVYIQYVHTHAYFCVYVDICLEFIHGSIWFIEDSAWFCHSISYISYILFARRCPNMFIRLLWYCEWLAIDVQLHTTKTVNKKLVTHTHTETAMRLEYFCPVLHYSSSI